MDQMSKSESRRCVWPLLAVALLTASCSQPPSPAEPDPILQAIGEFHTDVEGKRFSRIYRQAAPELKSSASENEFTKLLETVSTNLGSTKRIKIIASNVGSGEYLGFTKILCETTFSHGNGEETFTLKKDGNKYKLAGYWIVSNELNGKLP